MKRKKEAVEITNEILNTLLKRRFGNDYTIRIDSIIYYKNRDHRNGFKPFYEDKMYLITPKNVRLSLIQEIYDFILVKFNHFSSCFDSNNYIPIEDINIILKQRSY